MANIYLTRFKIGPWNLIFAIKNYFSAKMSFKYETIKYKIQKGDQGFGIALGGGGSKRNEVTGEAG